MQNKNNNIFPSQFENLNFRLAFPNDYQLTYKYINDSEVRSQSFSTGNITFEKHKEWFLKKINSESGIIIIVEDIRSKDFLGQVRFDKLDDDTLLVGIFVNPEKKGRGLGNKILTITTLKACDFFKSTKVIAQIKKTNVASIKAFSNAGYVFYKDVIIKNEESVEMIYLKSDKKIL